jgi:hypothetical protein
MVNVTIRANTWNGVRSKVLIEEQIKQEVKKIVEEVKRKKRWPQELSFLPPIALAAPFLGKAKEVFAYPIGSWTFGGGGTGVPPVVTKGLPPGTVITPPPGMSIGVNGSGEMIITPTPLPVQTPPVPTASPPVEAGASVIPDAATSIPPDAYVVPAAAMGDGIKSTILHAFDPLVDLIVTLSYPIAGVMIAGGCLFMFFNREKGIQILQNAAIGYILVQLSPLLLKLLVGIGNSV